MTITIQPTRPAAPRREMQARGAAARSRRGPVPVGDRRPPPPNYRLRRLVAGAVVAASTLAVALVLSVAVVPAGSGGGPAAASGASPAPIPTRYVARPGDTLWSIAEAHRGEVELRRYLDALVELNGGTAIEAGQAVRLP